MRFNSPPINKKTQEHNPTDYQYSLVVISRVSKSTPPLHLTTLKAEYALYVFQIHLVLEFPIQTILYEGKGTSGKLANTPKP